MWNEEEGKGRQTTLGPCRRNRRHPTGWAKEVPRFPLQGEGVRAIGGSSVQ
jgi:hypothetical protein